MTELLNIAHLFPEGVTSYCCRINDYIDKLHPDEKNIISKSIDKRKKEFSTGRLCIRNTLILMGISNAPILRNKNGCPLWPKKFTGTISHSNSWAGAAVAKTEDIIGVGLDIETVNRINSRILKRIITEQEAELMKVQKQQEAQNYAALIFSAKEAIYKALSPIYAETLRFKDVSVTYKDDSPEFEIKLSNKLKSFLKEAPSPFCRFMIHDNDIFTAITFPKSS